MSELNIQRFQNSDEAAIHAGFALNKLLEDNKDQSVLLLLSGGSAFSLLDSLNPENFSEQTTISVLDERFSSDPKISNFAQLQKTDFYKEVLHANTSFFGTQPKPGETKEQVTARMEKNLRDWKKNNKDGKIFATLGMGTDGHTAGIMPFPESPDEFKKLFENEAWAVAYNAGNKNQFSDRITTTVTFLKQIDASVAYIVGKNKKEAFGRLLQKSDSLPALPALVFYEIKNLQIFTDLQ